MTNTWWDYVQRISGGATQTEIAKRTKLSPASVSRWQRSEPKPSNANAFAVAYGRPVIEAFIAAGYMTEEQAGSIVTRTGHELAEITTADMLEELTSRIPGARDYQAEAAARRAREAEPEVITVQHATATVPETPQTADSSRSTPAPRGSSLP